MKREYSEGQLRWLINKLHVSTTDEEVTENIAKRAASWPADQRQDAINLAIQYHHENQQLYRDVMSGRLH